MPRTITLATLNELFPLSGREREKIKTLLPKELSALLLIGNQPDNECKDSYISYIFNCSFNGKNIGAQEAYARVAEIIIEATDETVVDFIEKIANNWKASNQDFLKRISDLRTILDNDEERKIISEKLRNRLNNALLHRDEKLLRKVSAVLTILAITRDGSKKQWQSISEKLHSCFPYVSSLPGNPSAIEEANLKSCHSDYKDSDLERAGNMLAELLRGNNLWNAYVLKETGKFWFKEFIDKNPALRDEDVKAHIAWLYENIFSEQDNYEETLRRLNALKDGKNDKEYNELLQRFKESTALNFFREAQIYLDEELDEDALIQWREVSEIYLAKLLKLYEQGRAELLTDFEESASAATQQHCSWYGEAYRRIAETCLKTKDECFIKYLKLARELNDNVKTKYLALRALSPLKNDPDKEFLDKLRKKLSTEWNAHDLATDLKDSEHLRIRGVANWRLYLDSDKKIQKYLREAWHSGFPREAVREWEDDVVSYCDKLERADSNEETACILNTVADHPLSEIFEATRPKSDTFKIFYTTNRRDIKSALENLCAEKLIALLADDDAEKNLVDCLHLLEALKSARTKEVTIFIRGKTELLTLLDTALNQFFNRNADNQPLLRVEIIDELREAAQNLLARHPLFYPIIKNKKNKLDETKTLHFAVIGDGDLAKNLIREAACFPFHKSLKINMKITLLSPVGCSLLNELKTTCPAVIDFVEERQILLPDFPAPDNVLKTQTLPEVVEEFFVAEDELYFAVAFSRKCLDNLSLAIKIRETLLRAWLKYSNEVKPPMPPVAFYCPDPDIFFLSARSVVLGEEYGSAPNFANSYNLIPFGSRIRFSYQNLVNNIFSKLSLAIHLNYCGMTSDNFSEEVCLKNYVSYARKTYNKCSSLAVAVSLPYRLFNYSQLFDTEVFDESWDITDESAIFSEDNLRELAEHINIPRDDDRTKKLYQWEHLRWNRYATFNEAWITTSPAQVEKYITAGNHRQQLFSAKVHPCIIKWSELDDLSQKISQMLRNNGVDLKKDKNFKKSDEDSILLTKEILEESVLKKSAALQKLFL